MKTTPAMTVDIPEPGDGFCPACRSLLKLSDATPSFLEHIPESIDSLIYVLCRPCADRFETSDENERKTITHQCFKNLKLSKSPSGYIQDWAVTSTLALFLNGNNFAQAHELGHGLTREEYFAICQHPPKAMIRLGDFLLFETPTRGENAND